MEDMMEYKKEEKEAPNRGKVEILTDTFEEGIPASSTEGSWRHKLTDRKDIMKYLKEGERYWYGDGGHGSEKRKNPA
jgi:hypothetical protein